MKRTPSPGKTRKKRRSDSAAVCRGRWTYFFVQYVGQIAPTVIQQMAVFAQAKSLSTGRKIYYGVIDGQDSARIVAAYSKAFK